MLVHLIVSMFLVLVVSTTFHLTLILTTCTAHLRLWSTNASEILILIIVATFVVLSSLMTTISLCLVIVKLELHVVSAMSVMASTSTTLIVLVIVLMWPVVVVIVHHSIIRIIMIATTASIV